MMPFSTGPGEALQAALREPAFQGYYHATYFHGRRPLRIVAQGLPAGTQMVVAGRKVAVVGKADEGPALVVRHLHVKPDRAYVKLDFPAEGARLEAWLRRTGAKWTVVQRRVFER
jgi:hypothetical protein